MPHFGETGKVAGAAISVAPSGSPYTYTAPSNGLLLVSAGTVTLIEYVRLGSLYVVGLLAGAIPVARGDGIKLTYVVAPTVSFVPS